MKMKARLGSVLIDMGSFLMSQVMAGHGIDAIPYDRGCTLTEFMDLAFARLPGESYRR